MTKNALGPYKMLIFIVFLRLLVKLISLGFVLFVTVGPSQRHVNLVLGN